DLAKLLDETMHLPKNHVFVKTITCCGAGIGTIDDKGGLMALNSEACFASVLALALGKRRYDSIMVRGYPGFVGGTTDQKTVTMKFGGDRNNPRAFKYEYIKDLAATINTDKLDEIWFNAKGERMWDITVRMTKHHYGR